MKKIYLYSWSSMESVERKLNTFEKSGYRVEMVLFNYIFIFRKNKKESNATYYLSKYMPKDGDSNLSGLISLLTPLYHASPVKSKHSSITLWRINKPVDASFRHRLIFSRNRYCFRALFHYLLLFVFLLMIFLIALLTSKESERFFPGILVTVFTLLAGWNVLGIVRLKVKSRD